MEPYLHRHVSLSHCHYHVLCTRHQKHTHRILKKVDVWHQDVLTPVVGRVKLRCSATYCIITTRVSCVTSRTSHTCSKFGNSRQCLTFLCQIVRPLTQHKHNSAAVAFSNRLNYYRNHWLGGKKAANLSLICLN